MGIQLLQFPLYDSGQSIDSAINIDSIVMLQPAPQNNTTVELNTGTVRTIMLPYAQVLKKISGCGADNRENRK